MEDVLRKPVELIDDDLDAVAGGDIAFAVGSFTSTTNSAVVGIQANTGFNGGVDNYNLAIANEAVFLGNDFS